MFEKNVNDLVRGLRNHKADEAKFIAQCLDQIKQELRQENVAVKTNAVAKLTYLQMLGYDISWAAFNIIEVMSSTKFIHKRIGYLAASQCFHEELDVLMLTTNLIKKDMSSHNQYDAGVAMGGLSCFVTPDLARDLANDIMSHVVSTRTYMRKRAVLLMYKVFLNFPEALRPAFPRLKEKLEDPEPGVQCAAVNVICELARMNPKNYLSLAPLFFKLMTTSSNNWMLIKIIKLFGALCPMEPRLGKKLQEPLTNLIHSTSAMSLLYECINTVVAGLPDHQPSMQLCVSKLRLLIEDQDQNLKYLGLWSLNNILKKQPKLVLPLRDLVIQCLDDRDESIRYRALDLIVGMISKKTLVDITRKLMQHLEKSEGTQYRDELLAKIIQICSQSNYQYITNFEWYVDVLVQLAGVEVTKHGKLLASQMLDVSIRVKAVRRYAVPTFAKLLEKPQVFNGNSQSNSSCEVLYAAAWIAGEFSQYLEDTQASLNFMLHQRLVTLPGHIQSVYIQNIAKLYSRVLQECEKENDAEKIVAVGNMLLLKLQPFTQSSDLEVQERACCIQELIKYILKMQEKGVSCSQEVNYLFDEELVPVAAKAQKKVPVPEGLDLDKWINDPPSESSSDEEPTQTFFGQESTKVYHEEPARHIPELSEEEKERLRKQRMQMQAQNPMYLKPSVTTKLTQNNDVNVDNIPVQSLDLPVPLKVEGDSTRKGKKKRRKGKKRHGDEEDDDVASNVKYEVASLEEGDFGAETKAMSEPDTTPDTTVRMLDMDLDAPLEDHEILPVRHHRVVDPTKKASIEEGVDTQPKKKKKHHKSKETSEKAKKHKRRRNSKHEDVDEDKSRKERSSSKSNRKRASSHKHEKHTSATGLTEAEVREQKAKATLLAQAQSAKTKSADEMESIDFWLTNEDVQETPEKTKEAAPEAMDVDPVSRDSPVTVGEITEKPTPASIPETKKSKKKSKEKSSKSDKKEKKKSKKSKEVEEEKYPAAETVSVDVSAAIIGEEDAAIPNPFANYSTLGQTDNLKLLYMVKADATKQDQLIVSVIFNNICPDRLIQLEFNVIDSLNMKLIRSAGASSHDPVLVPFQLPSGATNEGQFAFTVGSIVMAQWLRGTLTYIVKGADGSTHEKIDFKLSFPVSSAILPIPISSTDFATLLSSGNLKEKHSSKVTVGESCDINTVVKQVCRKLHLTEFVANSASCHGVTIQHHPICLLLKLKDDVLSIDGKSTEHQLLSNLSSEIKELLTV